MMRAAQFARERNVPYFGICLGMQMAVIEATRNLLGVKDAGSEEFDHEAGKKRFEPVVYHLKEWLEGNRTIKREIADDKGGTMRLGAYNATLTEGSQIPGKAGKGGAEVLRHVPGRKVAGDRGDTGASVVHGGAISPGTEVETLRAAPAVRGFC
jgi:CTP synthase (UTP-ammonia lyase)